VYQNLNDHGNLRANKS